MKNKTIQDILDKLNEGYDDLEVWEFSYLDNYITNLQTIEQQYSAILSENAELENKITNLQQENERLKEKSINEVLKNDFDMCVKDLKKANKKIEKLEDYKSRIEKAAKDLFELKDMIYKPETRDENIPIQQKISSIIKQLNGRSDE